MKKGYLLLVIYIILFPMLLESQGNVDGEDACKNRVVVEIIPRIPFNSSFEIGPISYLSGPVSQFSFFYNVSIFIPIGDTAGLSPVYFRSGFGYGGYIDSSTSYTSGLWQIGIGASNGLHCFEVNYLRDIDLIGDNINLNQIMLMIGFSVPFFDAELLIKPKLGFVFMNF